MSKPNITVNGSGSGDRTRKKFYIEGVATLAILSMPPEGVRMRDPSHTHEYRGVL